MNSSGQKITTTGNATIIAYDESPILSTDPWFGDEDSAYFGSWTLSHMIPKELKNDIKKLSAGKVTKNIYTKTHNARCLYYIPKSFKLSDN